VLAAFAVMLLHFLVLYRTRVRAPTFASLGAAFSAMALQLTVGRAVADGLISDKIPFLRTAKGSTCGVTERFPVLWEGVLGILLLIGAWVLYVTNESQAREIYIFSMVLLVQSLPFIAAVAITLLERSPLNEFGTWRRLSALATYRPRLPRGREPSAGGPASGGVGIVP
jgi:hypothetical protein